MMKITKKNYTQIFGITVVLLAIFRCASIDRACGNGTTAATADSISTGVVTDSMATDGMEEVAANPTAETRPIGRPSLFFNADGTQVKNRIYSVPHFGNTFPDQNDVQLAAAQRHGVKAVLDRKDAERRKSELVYVGNNPFFHVDRLNNSIPYLVPSASELLQDIGKAFFDSLQTKQIPLHKIIVTSVLRSKADVAKLRQHNSNATENSCHLYGTTFDVCYNRYKTVEDPQGPRRRQVRNDSLKWVLSEVLNDMRQQKRCLVKYEVKQGCFHITVN
jgi:hypothetical protein